MNLRMYYDQTLYIAETQSGALNLFKGGPAGRYITSLSVGQHWPGWEVDRVAQDLYQIYYTITNAANQTYL